MTTTESDLETRHCQQRNNVNILNGNLKQGEKIKPNHMTPVTSSIPTPPPPTAQPVPATLASRWRHTARGARLLQGSALCCFCLNVLPFAHDTHTASSLCSFRSLSNLSPSWLTELHEDRDYCLIFHCFSTRFLSFKSNRFISQKGSSPSNKELQILKYNKCLHITSSWLYSL